MLLLAVVVPFKYVINSPFYWIQDEFKKNQITAQAVNYLVRLESSCPVRIVQFYKIILLHKTAMLQS